MITAEDAIRRLGERFGVHAGMRALHARGIICSGVFAASPEAARLTTAAHIQAAEVPVLARLSNGSGDPGESDRAPDVRGLAVSFELADGERTDILAQNAPRFPVKDPDAFIELVVATKREPAMLAKLPWFLLRHPSALPAMIENQAALRPPAAYAAPTYYAVHAFRWTDPDGVGRWVRYTWRPVDPGPDAPEQGRSREYLAEEVAERLPERPIRFDLEVQIAEDGDDPHDPTSRWPAERRRVIAGSLTLDAVAEGHDGIIFDPMRLTDGIGPSDDPILRFRPKAYAVSYDQRTGADHKRPPWVE